MLDGGVLMMRPMSVELEELGIDLGEFDEQAPPADDKFCHINVGDGRTTYCGYRLASGVTCKTVYAGEAICPDCGRPTCPDCAVMSSLNERLEGLA